MLGDDPPEHALLPAEEKAVSGSDYMKKEDMWIHWLESRAKGTNRQHAETHPVKMQLMYRDIVTGLQMVNTPWMSKSRPICEE